MDLSFGDNYEDFRRQTCEFLDKNRDRAPAAGMGAGDITDLSRGWQTRLIEHGYAARTIPEEYGGFGGEPDPLIDIIIDEEFRRAGVAGPMMNQGISMLVPTLLEYGNEEHKRSYIGPTIRGEMIWCQGYSEPGAGSDLAGLRTSAVVDGDDFVVNGQKIWTSTAREAAMMFALVRTEPDTSKHAGISYLLLSMDSKGLEVRPLKTMTGASSFNEVFFDDVRVPRTNLVGARGQGWEIGTATLVFERNMLGSTSQTETIFKNLVAVAEDFGVLSDAGFRQRLVELQARVLAMKYHSLRLLTDKLQKRASGAAGLVTKLNGCQLNHDICALAIDAMEESGVFAKHSKGARDNGEWQAQYMFSLGMIIGGGTAQIQKNIIAERGLGMPREPRAAVSGGES
ncbi:MAG: acyl-CoA dehydrogenase family protein [Deltaproteobacteria bacterium]